MELAHVTEGVRVHKTDAMNASESKEAGSPF